MAEKQGMRSEIEEMPEAPQHRGAFHRRAHSDTSFRCFDDLLLFDPSDLDLSSLDLPPSSPNPTPSRITAMAVDSSDDSSSNGPPHHPPPALPKPASSSSVNPRPISHLRSLSVDSDFFDGLSLNPTVPAADDPFGGKAASLGAATAPAGERRGYHHRHSNSMDGTSLASLEVESFMAAAMDGVKKAMAPDKLAELALIDPKRAKRILANRQSAARSKERKIRYTNELERKVQTLQTEATTLSAQVTMLQRDTTGLTAENKELKLRLQAMEQQAQLRDALNEALREEVQRLKIAAGQVAAVNGNPFNRPIPQFPTQQPAMHQFGSHQPQQQQQLPPHVPQSSTNNQSLNGQPHPSFMDFNNRV